MAYGHAGRALPRYGFLQSKPGNCSLAWRSSTQSSRTGGKRFTVPRAVFIAGNLPSSPLVHRPDESGTPNAPGRQPSDHWP